MDENPATCLRLNGSTAAVQALVVLVTTSAYLRLGQKTSIFTPRFTRFPSISWLASTRIALEGPAVAAMAMSVVIATDSEAKLALGCRVRSKGSFRGVTGCRPMSAYAQGCLSCLSLVLCTRVSYILACREPQFPGCFCDDAKIQ